MSEALAVLRGRIDQSLYNTISALNAGALQTEGAEAAIKYPAEDILASIHKFSQGLSLVERAAFNAQMQAVWEVAERQVYPLETRLLSAFIGMVEKFLSVETIFDSMNFTDVVRDLKTTHAGDLALALATARSHLNLEAKNAVMLEILDVLKTVKAPTTALVKPRGIPLRGEAKYNIRNLKMHLTALSNLRAAAISHVSFGANLLLMQQYSVTTAHRREKLNFAINEALTSGDPLGFGERVAVMKKFAESSVAIRDLTIESLNLDPDYQIAFMELYLRKVYQKTHVLGSMTAGHGISMDGALGGGAWLRFEFVMRSATEGTSGATGLPARATSYHDLNGLADAAVYSDSDNEDDTSTTSSASTVSTASPSMRGGKGAPSQTGIFAVVEDFSEAQAMLPAILAKIPTAARSSKKSLNVAYVVLMRALEYGESRNHAALEISAYLNTPAMKMVLAERSIRRITFLVGKALSDSETTEVPTIYTFRATASFAEDRLYRHIEAPQAFLLDLGRLSNFDISLEDGVQTSSGNVHLYRASPAGQPAEPVRYFARLVSFTANADDNNSETLFVEALDHLAIVMGQNKKKARVGTDLPPSSNHIFLNIVAPDNVVSADFYVEELRRMCARYSDKLVRLGVAALEIKLTCRLKSGADPVIMRLVASNPTGYVLRVERYYEAFTEGRLVFKSLEESRGMVGEWDGKPTSTPYPLAQKFELKRAVALASSDTLYAYDWPVLFEAAAKDAWAQFAAHKQEGNVGVDVPSPADMFSCRELVLCSTVTSDEHEKPVPLSAGWDAWVAQDDAKAQLYPMDREQGANNAGMVAWLIEMRTPEYPDGRSMVLVSNDITYQAGSFGTREDIIFHKASRYARKLGIPRLYLAANSGARIGMAQSLKKKFQVRWNDASDPSKGFKYIYFTPTVYNEALSAVGGDVTKLPYVCAEVSDVELGTLFKVTDIIGDEEDLGVENLMGSGLIAGETSRAYDDIFTLTLVVGRTVGIGAYLVRLGQRTIQKNRNAPVILTGYQALNKLMGRDIYTTNDQLGGPMIMFPNGVSHLLAQTHLDAVTKALQWLAFVPRSRSAPLPVLDIAGIDSVDRLIAFTPQKGLPYDPRNLLQGVDCGDQTWEGGFFDRHSFVETLSGWAKTVVVGRARLGGVPMGVIVTENRTSEALCPADPADMTSTESMVQQAGGVWFPDSAYKTAQALKDFNREKLPCIIFANWRGFSGGQRDMFNEVLKFGSMIVDALVDYSQPIFVYIPPFAELRGGAWVVVDSTINADVMEFYAAENARGGVLEPAGAASIKFRAKDVLAAAHRLDANLARLVAEQKAGDDAGSDTTAITAEIKKREKMLMGVYSQVAVHFADLHDTPGRMKAKNVIRAQVPWAKARTYFYHRLRRRLTELDLVVQVRTLRPRATASETLADFRAWYLRRGGDAAALDDDEAFMSWLTTHSGEVQTYLSGLRDEALVDVIADSLSKVSRASSASTDAVNLIRSALEKVPANERAVAKAAVLAAFS